jgi:transcriptional/translational regulatory protein YebC/TACO1
MLVYIAIAVPSIASVGFLLWVRAKLKAKLSVAMSSLTAAESKLKVYVNTSDITKVLNALRADESNAKGHAYTMISKMKTEINKLGGQ